MNDASNISESSLEANGVSKRYGVGPYVLQGFSYRFEPGTITRLAGPNGAGKTTLMSVLSARSFPTEGSVKAGTLDIHQSPTPFLHQTGLVFTDTHLPQQLSAVDLVDWVIQYRQPDHPDSKTLANTWLDRVLLDERRQKPVGTYSTGMLKKTELAIAFAGDPHFLILDEPFHGLDTQSSARLIEILVEQKNRGAVVILSNHTHDSELIAVDSTIEFPIVP